MGREEGGEAGGVLRFQREAKALINKLEYAYFGIIMEYNLVSTFYLITLKCHDT